MLQDLGKTVREEGRRSVGTRTLDAGWLGDDRRVRAAFRLVMSFVLLAAFARSAGLAGDVRPTSQLTLEGAKAVLSAAKAESRRLKAPGGTIAIVDSGGHLLLLERLEGTAPVTPPIAIGKARTAAIFRAPTEKFEQIITKGRASMLAIEGWTPMQGGIPIVVNGEVVGGVGVSGAASAPQDEEIATAGAKALADERR